MRSQRRLSRALAVLPATVMLCASCATLLAPDAEKVRVVTAGQKRAFMRVNQDCDGRAAARSEQARQCYEEGAFESLNREKGENSR